MNCGDIAAQIYFEKQEKLMCGLHAVNNLLGSNIATIKSFVKIANDLIDTQYARAPRRVSIEKYRSNIQKDYYDCKQGFFTPEIQNAFINSFTDYRLHKMKYRSMTDKEILQYARRNKNVYGFMLSVSKYFKSSKNTYNHSISIRIFRNEENPEEVCAILLDSELDHPYTITEYPVFFDGDSKIYSSINMIQSLKEKTEEDILKKSQNIILDLTNESELESKKHRKEDGINDIIHAIEISPKLFSAIKKIVSKNKKNR